MLGVGGSTHAAHSYAGLIYSPRGSLSESGPLVRIWMKTFGFTYQTDLPGRPDQEIKALGYGVEAEGGWQIAGAGGRAAAFLGAAWRDHKLEPSDPGSGLEDGRLGLSLAVDGEWRMGRRLGVMANASYVAGFDQYWAQGRPFVDLGDGWRVGIDVAGFGGPHYATVRAGLFMTGYELPWAIFGRTFLSGEAGVQKDLSGGRVAPFLGLHAGVLF